MFQHRSHISNSAAPKLFKIFLEANMWPVMRSLKWYGCLLHPCSDSPSASLASKEEDKNCTVWYWGNIMSRKAPQYCASWAAATQAVTCVLGYYRTGAPCLWMSTFRMFQVNCFITCVDLSEKVHVIICCIDELTADLHVLVILSCITILVIVDMIHLQSLGEDYVATTDQNSNFVCSCLYHLKMMIRACCLLQFPYIILILHCYRPSVVHVIFPRIHDHPYTCGATHTPLTFFHTPLKYLQYFCCCFSQ